MTVRPDAPADTRMMRIVHNALRRDLRRAREVLCGDPSPSPRQQEAVARHLAWMMDFLRAHHRFEDEALFPLVRQRDPGAEQSLEVMHVGHEAVAAAISDVEAAIASGRRGRGADDRRLLIALDRLADSLVPHLQQEEEEMMPIVSAVVSAAEWQALEQTYNLESKSFLELGREGHWLIDGADPDDRQTVLGLVPAIPRFVLLHGMGRSYRRQAAARWDGSARPDRRVQKHGRCEVWTDAAPDDVWDVVRDVTRTGEWSHECVTTTWLGGATAAEPGARFRGRNRTGVFRWGRTCEIVTAEPYELVWRTVPSTLYPDSTEWAIRLHPADGGTRIEQTFAVVRAPKVLDMLYGLMIPAHRDRTAALTEDMRRLAALAARPPDGNGRTTGPETALAST